MPHTLILIGLIILLFLGLILLFEVGRRLGARRASRDPENGHSGVGSVESAVFGLMGLMIGFSFFGAAQRFDYRRDLVIDETNRVRAAYLRVDFLPEDRQAGARELFREYLDERIRFYKDLDNEAAAAETPKTKELQSRIWQEVVSATAAPGAHPNVALLLPAVNDMFAITTTRTMAMQKHPPMIIFLMLIGLSLAGATLAGFQMSKSHERNWLHMIGFAAVIALVIYVILDMEYPRMGLIRMTYFDEAMSNLRSTMN